MFLASLNLNSLTWKSTYEWLEAILSLRPFKFLEEHKCVREGEISISWICAFLRLLYQYARKHRESCVKREQAEVICKLWIGTCGGPSKMMKKLIICQLTQFLFRDFIFNRAFLTSWASWTKGRNPFIRFFILDKLLGGLLYGMFLMCLFQL